MDHSLAIRLARPDDLPFLARLEQQAFITDRLDPALIENLMTAERATVFVAARQGHICGAACMLWKRNTSKARLFNILVEPDCQGMGVGSLLLRACESETAWRGYAFLILELRKDNWSALRLYEKHGFRPVKHIPGFYEDGAGALQMSKAMKAGPGGVRLDVPYYRQTTPFTCGSACLMMAISRLRPEAVSNQTLEMNLWKEATSVYMASGFGGADPYGLALAAQGQGLSARVLSSNGKNPFILTVREGKKRKIVDLLHEDMKTRAKRKNIAVTTCFFDLQDIIVHLHRGWLPIALISTYKLTGFRGLHWVLVTGYDKEHVFINDPDANSYSQNPRQAVGLPVPYTDFLKLLVYGKTRSRFVVLVGPPDQLKPRQSW